MNLEPLYVQALPYLTRTGATEHVTGVLDVFSIDIGHRHFVSAQGLSYDASLVNTGEALLLSGKASTILDTSCDRCLEPTRLDITGEIQGYYLFDASKVKAGDGLEEYEEVDSDGRVDLAPPILAAIVFEIPTVVLCEASCSGIALSPDAEAAIEEVDNEKPPSPFEALKDFKFEE